MNILHKISYDGHESVVRKPHSNCIMKSVSGEKVSFSDGSDHPITRLVLSIDMNEDYNGYDKAWAGGEGKNLLPQFITDGTYNGVTFTTNKDGSISSEGTATGAVYVASIRIALEAGTYYFTGTPAGGSASTYNSHADLYDGTTLLRSLGLDTGEGLSFTISAEEAGKEAEFVLHIAEGVTAPEDTWKFFLCTENIPFEPYENISTLIPYDQVTLKVNGHYYVQDLPEEFCAGFVDLIAGRIVSSYHTDHTENAEQTNIEPREICTQTGENKMSMNVPGTIEVIYCVDMKMLIDEACKCDPIPNTITDPKDGQIMMYDAAAKEWVNIDFMENLAPQDNGDTASIKHISNTLFIRSGKLCIAYKFIAVGDELVEGGNYGEISLSDFYVKDEVLDHKTPIILQAGAETEKTLTTRLETLGTWSYWGYNPDILEVVSRDATNITIKPKSKAGTCVIGIPGKFKGTQRMTERWTIVVCE